MNEKEDELLELFAEKIGVELMPWQKEMILKMSKLKQPYLLVMNGNRIIGISKIDHTQNR